MGESKITDAARQYALYGQYRRVTAQRAEKLAQAQAQGTARPETPRLAEPTLEDGYAGRAYLENMHPKAIRTGLAASRTWRTDIENQRTAEQTAKAQAELAKVSANRQAFLSVPTNLVGVAQPSAAPPEPADRRVAGWVPGGAQVNKIISQKPGGVGQVGTQIGIYGSGTAPRRAQDEKTRSDAMMSPHGP